MIRKSKFIGRIYDNIEEYYDFIAELGSGCYGKVFRVKEKFSGYIRACKVINKNRIKRSDRFKTEIELLKTIDHHNIVKLLEIYEDNIYVYLVMEECLGGELFDVLSERAQKGKLISELQAADLFKQIMSAIAYLHINGISHRDLKPENILFNNKDQSYIKIIDFGLSKIFKIDDTMNSIVGTLYYMSPEMIRGVYNEKCDIWSAGVILHFMLCGRPPFLSSNPENLKEKILEFKYDISDPYHKYLSNEAKDLLKKILIKDDLRISSTEILAHDWINNLSPYSYEPIVNLDIDYFLEYSTMNKIRRSIISFISYRFNFIQTEELTKIFKSLDKNSDGCLSFEEFSEGLLISKKNNIIDFNEKYLKEIFDEIDLNTSGTIEYSEFISSTIKLERELKTEHVIEAFRIFDKDKNGKISLKELTDVIKPRTDTDVDALKELIKKFDLNGDGEIDIKEFFICLGIQFN
jgi:calcium-dependent protein kinase